MDHRRARAIIAAARPDLIIDNYDYGSHINIKASENGQTHSITLPYSTERVPLNPDQERDLLLQSLEDVDRFL